MAQANSRCLEESRRTAYLRPKEPGVRIFGGKSLSTRFAVSLVDKERKGTQLRIKVWISQPDGKVGIFAIPSPHRFSQSRIESGELDGSNG